MSTPVTWEASLHTLAKLQLLRSYLDAWFPILGKYNQRLNYIDGFAGPGTYAGNQHGSPLVAIQSATQHVQKGTLSPQVKINFMFIENDKTHADHLLATIKEMDILPQFNVNVVQGAFRDKIEILLQHLETNGKILAPTFAFVDPFGFSGIPMTIMQRILRYPKCEVFVNVMVDFINRFLEHPNDNITKHFPETFGTEDVLKVPAQSGDRFENILSLYKAQISQFGNFVGRFDMHGRTDRKTYSLFFASNNPSGFLKMKEAMWKVDQLAGNKFSDADPNPDLNTLFELWGIEPLWDQLENRYRGQTILMGDLETFVIEKTDYLPKHARKILSDRESSQAILVEPVPGQKRRGRTFHSDKVRIKFST